MVANSKPSNGSADKIPCNCDKVKIGDVPVSHFHDNHPYSTIIDFNTSKRKLSHKDSSGVPNDEIDHILGNCLCEYEDKNCWYWQHNTPECTKAQKQAINNYIKQREEKAIAQYKTAAAIRESELTQQNSEMRNAIDTLLKYSTLQQEEQK